MHIPSETRIFAKYLELLFKHEIPNNELKTWWGFGHQFSYSLVGHRAEITLSFDDFDFFEVIMMDRDGGRVTEVVEVLFDVTDEQLINTIEQTIQYILNNK